MPNELNKVTLKLERHLKTQNTPEQEEERLEKLFQEHFGHWEKLEGTKCGQRFLARDLMSPESVIPEHIRRVYATPSLNHKCDQSIKANYGKLRNPYLLREIAQKTNFGGFGFALEPEQNPLFSGFDEAGEIGGAGPA